MTIASRCLFWLPLCSLLSAAPIPRPPVTSSSTITIKGPTGDARTIALPWMNNFEGKGDWFATPNLSHATFLLADAARAKQGTLDVELNGSQSTFVLTADNTRNHGASRTSLGFSASVIDGNSRLEYGIDRADQVTLTVTRLDNLSMEATFSGTLTRIGGSDHVQVSGSIHLHRNAAPPEVSAGRYPDCDPVIHDWLNQAQDRAPSECEVKFDRVARTAFANAFAPMTRAFASQNWKITKSLEPAELAAMPRGSEKVPYRFGFAANADLLFQLDLSPAAPDYGQFRDNSRIVIKPDLNPAAFTALNFHGSYTSTPLPGGGTIVYLPEAQASTGGSAGDPTTWVLLGAWAPLAAKSLGDGSTEITAKASLNTAISRLNAQTITVRFRCSPDLAQKAINAIDWAALRDLISRRP